MSRHRWSLLLGAGVLLAAPVALAEPVPGKACKADLETACPGIEPGQGRILACLEGKTDQLSQACKDDVSKKFNALYKAWSTATAPRSGSTSNAPSTSARSTSDAPTPVACSTAARANA